MPASLHLFFTRALPEFDEDQQADLLLVDDDESDSNREIAPDELEYVTTLVTTYEDIDVMTSEVNRWWQDWAGSPVRLQLIADNPSHLAENELERLRKLGESSWSINTAFVAFRRESPEGRAEAIKFLIGSSIVSR